MINATIQTMLTVIHTYTRFAYYVVLFDLNIQIIYINYDVRKLRLILSMTEIKGNNSILSLALC